VPEPTAQQIDTTVGAVMRFGLKALVCAATLVGVVATPAWGATSASVDVMTAAAATPPASTVADDSQQTIEPTETPNPASPVDPDDPADPAEPTDTTPTDTTPTDTTPADTVPGDTPPAGTAVEPDRDDARAPAVPPSVRNSEVPLGSIVFAVLVLLSIGAISYRIVRRAGGPAHDRTRIEPAEFRPDLPTSIAPPRRSEPVDGDASMRRESVVDTTTLDFLLEIGEALIDAGHAVNHVELTLRTVARVNGIENIGVLILPTALVVSVPDKGDVMTDISSAGRAQLRLDQVDDALALINEAEYGEIEPAEGRRRLAAIRTSAPPYRSSLANAGYALSTVGLAVILRATWLEAAIAALLGLAVGMFRMSTRRLDTSYQPFIPLIAAAGVSVSVFATARVVDGLVTFPLLVAPLITFLPGALLTVAVLELATGEIVAGASRLASGVLKLVLLALGIVAGGELVGVPAGHLRRVDDGLFTTIAPWFGVAFFGLGVALFQGARRSAAVWILLVLYVAYSGQVIGGLFFGSALSAFFGAFAMTPVAVLAARQPSGPAPLVTFLPGFWLLVPGALGLEGVSRLLGGGSAGTGVLVTTVTSMVGISLGILLGLTLVADDPKRPWTQPNRRRLSQGT
jgi:uncharacterized membrane protein YjjP (DUF1212 family)